jgi:hypothetical protein
MQDFLRNRFSVYGHRATHPEVVGVPIERPVFIVGFPRTGTTILLRLLAQDRANRVPLGWEVQFPDPPPETATYDSDPRIAKAETMFGHTNTMAPSFASIHEVGAQLGQECMRDPHASDARASVQRHREIVTTNAFVVTISTELRIHRVRLDLAQDCRASVTGDLI